MLNFHGTFTLSWPLYICLCQDLVLQLPLHIGHFPYVQWLQRLTLSGPSLAPAAKMKLASLGTGWRRLSADQARFSSSQSAEKTCTQRTLEKTVAVTLEKHEHEKIQNHQTAAMLKEISDSSLNPAFLLCRTWYRGYHLKPKQPK